VVEYTPTRTPTLVLLLRRVKLGKEMRRRVYLVELNYTVIDTMCLYCTNQTKEANAASS
jgi:hypothetical protein